MAPPARSPRTPVGAPPRRIPNWTLTAAIVVALLSGAAGLVTFSTQGERVLQERLSRALGRAQQGIQLWELEELARVRAWAEDPAVAAAGSTIPASLAGFAKAAAGTDGIRAVALFSPQGALLASSGTRLLSDPTLGRRVAAIQRARGGTASVAGPIVAPGVRTSADPSDLHFMSAAPVLNAGGQVTAVLAFLYDTDAPLRRVRLGLRSDARAEAYLIDERGIVLTPIGPEAAGRNGATVTVGATDALGTPATRSAEGFVLVPYTGPRGAAVVGAWGSAAPLAARVVFELAADDLFGASRAPGGAGFALAAILVLAALALIYQQRGVEALRHAKNAREQELEVVIDSSPNGVLVVDDRGIVRRASRNARHLLDAATTTMLDSSIDRWLSTSVEFHPDRLSAFLEAASREVKGRRADGDEIAIEVRVGSGESDGRRIFTVVLLEAGTRKEAELALREARVEVERAKKQQTEFLTVMSTELRTPMSGVVGMAHLLAETPLSPAQKGYVESLMRSAQVLMTFVTDVLDLSKLEAGSLQLDESAFDLRVAISDVAELALPQARAKETVLEARISERTPVWVIGDTGRFRQVLINLVGNAIRFAPGGRVIISADGTRKGPGVDLCISVSDNGVGMEPEAVQRLLAPDADFVSRLKGGGLGLSMAKQLVALMRGKLEVKSIQGEGTTFKFRVTLRAAADGQVALASSALAGTRALLVDSSASDVSLTREWLRSWGMRVETTTTAEEAMGHLRRAAAEGDPVEVALVDRQTVGEQAEAFARRMRAEPTLAGTGLLVTTSGAGVVDADRLGAAGCDAMLAKPFSAASLSRTLAAVVERPRAERGRSPIIRGDVLSGSTPRPVREHPDGQIPVIERSSIPRSGGQEPLEDTRLRVLLADDNRVNQIVATTMLQRLGCRVEVVSDGAEAVRMASRHEFDVIFMDIQMPNLDGCSAAALIRRLAPPNNEAHIIALGTSASPDERDRYFASGMDDVVLKPVTPEAMQAALERRPAGLPSELQTATS